MSKLDKKLQKAGLTEEEVALCFYNKIKPYILDFLPTLNSLIFEAMLNTNSEKMTFDADYCIDGKNTLLKRPQLFPRKMTKKPLLPIPDPITPEQIEIWRDALKIDKGDACAMIGKPGAFWSRFLSGQSELELSQLNILLKNLKIRAQALD